MQEHEMRLKIEILTSQLTSKDISHKAEVEMLQNKLAHQQFDHNTEVERLQEENEKLRSELAKQQGENKMLFTTNLDLTNQVKIFEEHHKSKNNKCVAVICLIFYLQQL